MENRDLKNKVGIVWELDCYGGVQTCVIVLIQALNNQGITPILYCERIPSEKIKEEYKLNFEYELIQFNYHSIKKINILIYNLFRNVRISKFKIKVDKIYVFDNDVIIDEQIDSVRYISMPPFYYKSFSTGLKSILRHLVQKLICIFISKYRYNRERKVFINSKYTQEIFIKHFGYSIPVVYPPSLMEMTERRRFLSSNNDKSFVFFSRLNRDKNIEQFIQLAEKFLDGKYIIISSTNNKVEEDYLKKLMLDSERLDNLEFIVNQNNKQIENISKNATFFIFTREYEHFGIVTLDMMRLGLIPIVHNSGGQKELVPIERLRFNDLSDLSKKILYLVSLDAHEIELIQRDLLKNLMRFDNSNYINALLGYQ